MPEMQRSWLVQRLDLPLDGIGPFKDNPFSFGGGMENGGLSEGAMDLLRGIFSFDYMGSAEFEFGAVPEALDKIARGIEGYTAFSILEAADGKDVPIYVICPDEWVIEVVARISEWAHDEYTQTKEQVLLYQAMRVDPEGDRSWMSDRKGWLEIDNGFFFFIDREMYDKTCSLFGIEHKGAWLDGKGITLEGDG